MEALNKGQSVNSIGLGVNSGKRDSAAYSAKVKIGAILKCVVSGTPSEFPDDIRIANAGVVAIPPGTQLAWKIGGDSGVAALSRSLQPGKTLRLNGVLAGGVEAGTACSAKAIGL